MLADIAPSVAGWPAAKPKTAERDEGDRDHADADAQAVDDMLADKEPQEIWRARPARHSGPAGFQAAVAVPFNDWTARAAIALRPEWP